MRDEERTDGSRHKAESITLWLPPDLRKRFLIPRPLAAGMDEPAWQLTNEGLGMLMISSELEELVEGRARVVVMRDGQAVAELRGAEISQDSIVHAIAEVAAAADSSTA